jgi:hypothetical protein
METVLVRHISVRLAPPRLVHAPAPRRSRAPGRAAARAVDSASAAAQLQRAALGPLGALGLGALGLGAIGSCEDRLCGPGVVERDCADEHDTQHADCQADGLDEQPAGQGRLRRSLEGKLRDGRLLGGGLHELARDRWRLQWLGLGLQLVICCQLDFKKKKKNTCVACE